MFLLDCKFKCCFLVRLFKLDCVDAAMYTLILTYLHPNYDEKHYCAFFTTLTKLRLNITSSIPLKFFRLVVNIHYNQVQQIQETTKKGFFLKIIFEGKNQNSVPTCFCAIQL